MKYTNENFPYDFNDKELKDHTQECMKDGLGSDIENISFSIRAQLGLAEIHKRQNDRSNRIAIGIAILAIILSLSGIGIQWYISQKPQTIESKDIQEIKSNLHNIYIDQKTDSLLLYLKEISKNPILHKKYRAIGEMTRGNRQSTSNPQQSKK
jgi:hypothetical protein